MKQKISNLCRSAAVIMLLLCGIAVAWGQNDKLLPIRNDDASNVDLEKIARPGNLKIAPLTDPAVWKSVRPNTLAARIADRRNAIEWRPLWSNRAVAGVNLKGLSVTPDNSVVALVETHSDDAGIISSVIIFYETANWRIIRAIWLPGQQVNAFSLIPHTVLAAAYVRGQQALDQKRDTLLLIDCESGKVKENIPQDSHGNSDLVMACSSDFVAVKYFNARGIYFCQVVDGAPLLPKAEKDIPATAGLLAFSPDGRTLAWADAQGACTYEPIKSVLEKIALPPGFNPTGMVYTTDGLTIAHIGSPLWIFTGNGSREINVKTSGNMIWSPADRMLYVETLPKRSLAAMSPPQYQSEDELLPLRLKPASMGMVDQYQPMGAGKLIMLTSMGDLCLLEKSEKKWVKTVIASPIR